MKSLLWLRGDTGRLPEWLGSHGKNECQSTVIKACSKNHYACEIRQKQPGAVMMQCHNSNCFIRRSNTRPGKPFPAGFNAEFAYA